MGRFRITRWDVEGFRAEVGRASGRPVNPARDEAEEARTAIPQVAYLARYLGDPEIGARWMLVEQGHVDQSYAEEYEAYHARLLNPPPTTTTRLHFFRSLSGEAIDADGALERALHAAWRESTELAPSDGGARQVLQRAYLGFVVVRPLAYAPIGRTVLLTIPDANGKRRDYSPAAVEHPVHVGSIRLTITGAPFQQQDQRTGACATSALWTALWCAKGRNGASDPSTVAITTAANSVRSEFRRFPAAAGLTALQMAAAVEAFGAIAVFEACGSSLETFIDSVRCYAESGIPMVLHLSPADSDGSDHAVAVVGVRREPGRTALALSEGHHLPMPAIDRVFVHDDRLGPYARLLEGTPRGQSGAGSSGGVAPQTLRTKLRGAAPDPVLSQFDNAEWLPRYLLAPHYHKLRLTAAELRAAAAVWHRVFTELVDVDRAGGTAAADGLCDQLLVSTRFARAGDALRLAGAVIRDDETRLMSLMSGCRLSRWVGVVTVFAERHPVFCALIDGTDMWRREDLSAGTIAVVCSEAAISRRVSELLTELDPATRTLVP